MAIRIRNIDYNRNSGMRRHEAINIGDVSLCDTLTKFAFIVPVAAQINQFGFINKQKVSPSTTATLEITFQVAGNSGVTLARRTFNTCAVSDIISANQYFVVSVPGSSGTVSAGTVIEVQFSALTNNAGLSKVHIDCLYTPLTHRETY